jgi:hypothetical protein
MGWGSTSRIVAPIAAIVVAASLSGCEIAVTAVSFAATGMSYALTDKSPSDNALSVVADQDCALFRFVKGESICRDYPLPVQVASLTGISPEAGDMLEAPAAYRVHAGSALSVDRLAARNIELVGFSRNDEFFALVQDDGALEVFVHDPHAMATEPNIRLVVRIERYAADPDALQGIVCSGVFIRIKDISV